MQRRISSEAFVWSKFGTESGESIESIFARKEKERALNKGVFLWGIGNNIGPSLRQLIQKTSPKALFSPMVSPAKRCDEQPSDVARWTSASTLDGDPFILPAASTVTSRWSTTKRHHFALICYSDEPLSVNNSVDELFAQSLRNLVSGRKVGSSQVTSVVEKIEASEIGRSYRVAMKINLVSPYFVQLHDPVPLDTKEKQVLQSNLTNDYCIA